MVAITTCVHNNNDIENVIMSDVKLALHLTSELSQASLQGQEILLLSTLTAPFFEPATKRAPVQICAILDRSGSMSGEKLKLVKEATQFIVKQLDKNDSMSIVSYEHNATIDVPMLKMNDDNKRVVLEGLQKINAGGGTNIFLGLHEGLGTLRADTSDDVITTTILLTDGQANGGPTTAEGILHALRTGSSTDDTSYGPARGNFIPGTMQRVGFAPGLHPTMNLFGNFGNRTHSNHNDQPASLPARDIRGTINTFGFGSDHDATMLTQLAKQGDGGYYFVPNSDEIGDIFANCLGGLTSVFAQKIQIKFQGLGGTKISRAHTRYTNKMAVDKTSMSVNISDIQSEEHKDVVLRVQLPSTDSEGDFPCLRMTVTYKNSLTNQEETVVEEIQISRRKNPAAQTRPLKLDIENNRVVAAEHMETAVQQGDRGDLDSAMASIMNAMKLIQSSPSAADPVSVALVADLQQSTASLRSQSEYRVGGQQMLNNMQNSHWQQRQTNYTSPAQMAYGTSNRMTMQQQAQQQRK